MADKYQSFSELAGKELEGRDYCIRVQDRASDTVVIAIHGGGIEPGTSEIAEAIAGEELSFYTFEGIRTEGNRDLHITSHRFDEPQCIALVSASLRVISIHGEDTQSPVVFLGGKDIDNLLALRELLTARGFISQKHKDPNLQGLDHKNICNRARNGCGLQLELSNGLRRSFFKSISSSGRRTRTKRFGLFVTTVREVLHL